MSSLQPIQEKHDESVRFEAIFEKAVDGLIIIDNQGLIEKINASALELFDYQMDEIIGQNISVLMPSPHRDNHNDYINNYKKTHKPKIIGIGREVFGLKKNGHTFPFWLSVSEVVLSNKTIFVGIIHDLSDVKAAEKKLIELNERLEHKVIERTYELETAINKLLAINVKYENEIKSRIETEKKLLQREIELKQSLEKEKVLGEMKSRFVSMASHEFRTPLATILSSANLIDRYHTEEQHPQRNKHVNKIRSSVSHLNNILSDFLSMDKLEAGKIHCHRANVEIKPFMKIIHDEINTLAGDNQSINYTFETDADEIYIDLNILKNIILNLVSNALKYSDARGKVDFNLKIEDTLLTLSVKDNGMGIPKEDQPYLFERFFRASNALNLEGTGLGLNIVKKYLELLNGDIAFESQEQMGTTFFVKIPCNHAPTSTEIQEDLNSLM